MLAAARYPLRPMTGPGPGARMTSPPDPHAATLTTDPVLFAAPARRREAPQVADEREALEGWLDYFRSETILALDGLTEGELGRRVSGTGVSMLGIVRHLTELERTWLVERWGERGRGAHAPSYVDDPGAGVRESGIEHSATLVATYQTTCERGRDALAAAESLDDAVRDDRRGHIELRWILLHLITETARHAGQAQALRETLLAARPGPAPGPLPGLVPPPGPLPPGPVPPIVPSGPPPTP